MTDILLKEPQIGLCDDVFCFKCRELERRLNLYSKIKSPHVFQKNPIVRTILYRANKLVLREFRDNITLNDKTNSRIIKKDLTDYSIQAMLKIAATLLGRKQEVQQETPLQ